MTKISKKNNLSFEISKRALILNIIPIQKENNKTEYNYKE